MRPPHSDRQYERELQEVRDRISEMGARIIDMIAESVRAIVERNSEVAHKVIALDYEINRLEIRIDELCLSLLARRQPVASDLRFITTGLKLVTDLERMGDLCVNICERTIELNTEPPLGTYENLPKMAEIAQEMLREALEAFVAEDPERALELIRQDRTVDAYYAQLFSELLVLMREDPSYIYRATRLQSIAKYLERIADHATNLGEMVVFMVNGKDIRHLGGISMSARDRQPHGVLFLCVRNSARSQMAEGWARKLFPPGIRIWSAGTQPAAKVNPHAIRVMKEVGIDISRQRPKLISDIPLGDVDTVVTLCGEEVCVALPAEMRRELWSLPNPTAAEGTEEEIDAAFREVRDTLRAKFEALALPKK